MTINDLKPGMLVRTREKGDMIYQVTRDATIMRQDQDWLSSSPYRSDMTDEDGEVQFDIMEVRDCHISIDMDASDVKDKLHLAWMQGKILWTRNTSPKKLDLEIQELFKLLNSVGYD